MTLSLEPGQVVQSSTSCYAITTLLGEGAFAHVYQAQDCAQKGPVALKVSGSSLKYEAGIYRSVQHIAGIPSLYEQWDDEQGSYLALQHIAGMTLHAWIEKIEEEDQGVPLLQALWIALQLCGVIVLFHQAGIIHCDLKPANILVTEEQVWVIDLGIALGRGAEAYYLPRQAIMGTWGYVPPEYFHHGYVTPRIDIYALGKILYQLLTGHLLPSCTCGMVPCVCVQVLPLHGALGAFVMEMLELNWQDRPASVERISAALLEAHKHLLRLENHAAQEAVKYVSSLLSW